MSCRIASVTSYLSENEAKNLENDDVHLAQIPDFGMEYLENHFFGALRSVMAHFCTFHALSFELNFRPEFPSERKLRLNLSFFRKATSIFDI